MDSELMSADIVEARHRLIVLYRENTEALWDTLNSYGEIALILSQVHELVLQIPLEDIERADEIKSAIEAMPEVESVRFDRKTATRQYSVDPMQTIFGNDRVLTAVRAQEAWAIQTGRPDVVIAYTDTGCDEGHPDLEGAVLPREWSAESVDCLSYTTAGTDYPKRVDLQACATAKGIGSDYLWSFCSAFKVPRQVTTIVYFDAACTQPLAPGDKISPLVHRYIWITHPTGAVVEKAGSSTLRLASLGDGLVADFGGHGTNTVGVSVAQHNGKGVMGIAPGCRAIMFNAINTMWDSTTKAGLIALANNPDVAVHNASWGIVDVQGKPGPTVDSTDISAGFAYINNKTDGSGNREIVSVVAMGNYSHNQPTKDLTGNPAAYPYVMAVGATGAFGGYHQKAEFSARTDAVFISAPGTDYLTTMPRSMSAYERNPFTGQYELPEYPYSRTPVAGTSESSPLTAGVVALMKSEAKDLGITLTKTMTKQLIKEAANPWLTDGYGTTTYNTATPGPAGNPIDGMGWGLVDACRSLRAVRSEIDARFQRIYAKEATVGVASTLALLDVKTWGSGISDIKVYVNDTLNGTLTPGGTSYVGNLAPVFPATGTAVKVHCVATDINGSVSTSAATYFDVYPAAQPLAKVKPWVYYDENQRAYLKRAWSLAEDGDDTVLISTAGAVHVTLYAPTGGGSVIYSNVKFYVGDALVGNFTPPSTPTSAPLELDYTLNMAGVPLGFGTLRVVVTSSTGLTSSRDCPCVHTGSGDVGRIFAKPFSYKNGVLEVAWYAFVDQTQNSEPYVGLIHYVRLKIDGKVFFTDISTQYSTENYRTFRLQVPLPTSVAVEVLGAMGYVDWDGYYTADTELLEDSSLLVVEVPPAVGNDPNSWVIPPYTYVTRQSGIYATGVPLELADFNGGPSTIKYRWDSGAWQDYTAPLEVQTGTLSFYGMNDAGNAENVQTASYIVDPSYVLPGAEPTIVDGTASTTGTESSAQTGTATATGSGVSAATGAQATSETGTATASQPGATSGSTVAAGTQGTAATGTASAVGSGVSAAIGSEGISATGTVSATGTGTVSATGTGVSSQIGQATATGGGLTAGFYFRGADGTLFALKDQQGRMYALR